MNFKRVLLYWNSPSPMRLIDRFRRMCAARFEEPLWPAPTLKFRFRRYAATDRAAVLRIYDDNAPDRFPPTQRMAFEQLLDSGHESYFVAENETGEIIASGGVQSMGNFGHLLFGGLVAPKWQNHRVGTAITYARIVFAIRKRGAHFIRLAAVPKSVGFYQRFGLKQSGELKLDDGYILPLVGFVLYSDGLADLRDTLCRRGHLLDPAWPIQIDPKLRTLIKMRLDGKFDCEVVEVAIDESRK